MIKIRQYKEGDSAALWQVFFNTVRIVNARDYSLAQVKAWAPESFDMSVWENVMSELQPFIAEVDGMIVGYCDLQPDGLIDHFFCHHEYQGQGVGRALMNHILRLAAERGVARLYSHVSVTAQPFFERYDFSIVNEQLVTIRGQQLINYVMERQCLKDDTLNYRHLGL